MLRTLPIASPSSLTVSTYNKTSLPSQSSLKLSPFCVNNDGGNNISYCYSTSRRLALFQLGAAIPQSHFFGAKALKLLRAEGSTIEASTSGNMAPTSNTVTEQNVLDWVKSDKRRMLHVVYRVGDLDKTIKFYTECLGMKLLRKRDIPEDRYTNAFLGYGPEDSHFVVELTYNYGVDKYDIGTGFGHFGIAVEDVAKTVDLVKAKGGKVTREPGPVKGGNTVIAFIEDPDGYKFELLERGPTPEPLCQVMLRVGDLDRAINFYKKAFGMELLRKRDNPAQDNYIYEVDPRGVPQAVFRKGSKIKFRAGPWNGLHWTGTPQLQPNPVYTFEYVSNENEVFYRFNLIKSSVLTMMVINPQGEPQRLTWMEQTQKWAPFVPFSGLILDQCDNYALCGAYAICNMNSNSARCECLEGFVPKSPSEWDLLDTSDGCIRRTQLDCEHGDGFLKRESVKLPDTSFSRVDKNISILACKELCSKNCSCTAYANADVRGGGSGCLLWFHDLIDMKVLSEGGQDLYIRMATSELDNFERTKRRKKKKVVIIIICALLATGVILIGGFMYMRKKKRRDQGNTVGSSELDYIDRGNRKENMELPMFDWNTIADATDNFSWKNKLGEGGFGPVYRGMLTEGQEIAVKRLSKSSGQGVEEFKNEVLLIAKLQHRNLVRLLGCCTLRDERMLIYEYLPNKSLEQFIFDVTRTKFLDWSKRCQIIEGIARGLLYLHQDSRLRIIHRDLKASNVLLDNDMNPKISDFGMARAFGVDQTEANTDRVVGTYGYMSPEYAIDGLFSVKSDVFSFGVLVLEIVCGKRNRGFYHADHHHNLLGHAWRLWTEDRSLELIDKSLDGSYSLSEALRCIQVGLLCVQQRPEDRPNMSSVVLMLSGERSLPQPKQPGFFTERNLPESESSSSKRKLPLSNEITISLIEGR